MMLNSAFADLPAVLNSNSILPVLPASVSEDSKISMDNAIPALNTPSIINSIKDVIASMDTISIVDCASPKPLLLLKLLLLPSNLESVLILMLLKSTDSVFVRLLTI